MFLVGLTGGIAAGKSTVASLWESLGATIVDADVIARAVVTPGSVGLSKLVGAFGDGILDASGELDRSKLASLVFGDSKLRKTLEEILHPLIQAEAKKQIESATTGIVVYVIPLLVESKSPLEFDYVVTVEAPADEQVKRMTSNRGMTEQDARDRIASQASPASRAAVSDSILNSNQDLPLLLKDARTLWNQIVKLSTQKSTH